MPVYNVAGATSAKVFHPGVVGGWTVLGLGGSPLGSGDVGLCSCLKGPRAWTPSLKACR